MSAKQDKATMERHSRTLRELLKTPDNKTCADCKRNDPRWASWNLGVFLCIRCSGIHRSMGTHISKVKSVDLDVWTPEQMASIQKWGNRRANAYWERHLRVGHVPPDHKMESYIRSKYETRRWALAEPVPEDPSVLDSIAPPAPGNPAPAASAAQATSPTHASRASVSSLNATRTTQPQPHQLLSTAVAASRQVTGSPTPALAPPQRQTSLPQPQAQQAPQPQSAAVDLFSLDFHAPASATPPPAQQEQPKKDVKAEIMSLFSSAPAAAPAQQNALGGGFVGAGLYGAAPAAQPQNQFGGLGAAGMAAQANPWGGFGQPQQQQQVQQQQMPQQTSMMGNAGVGLWGAASGWNTAAAPAASTAQSSIWATPAPASQQNLFSTSDVWSTPATSTGGAPAAAATQKNNDAFGDLWGGFK